MQAVSVPDLIEFRDKRLIRKKLVAESLLEAELVCYEAGQTTREHFHKYQEEVYYIVEGSGSVTIGDDTSSISAGDLLFIPADTPHSIGAGGERMVLLFVKGPGQAAANKLRNEHG